MRLALLFLVLKPIVYSDSHKTLPEADVRLDSIGSRARKSVVHSRASDPRSYERGYGHSRDSDFTFENRYKALNGFLELVLGEGRGNRS